MRRCIPLATGCASKMIQYSKIYNLRRIVQSFRDAIDTAKANDESAIFFRKFPVGQCGYTTEMLAKYLASKGYTQMIYETGAYFWEDSYTNIDHEPNQHTWLCVDGLIVDITGDQFKHYDKPLRNDTPVYVGPKTPYFDLFEVHPCGRRKTSGYDPSSPMGSDLDSWYNVIMKYLNEHSG